MSGGQFKPGKSGNPGGRPKGRADAARALARYIQDRTEDGRVMADFALAVLLVDADPGPGRPTTSESERRRTLDEFGIKPEEVSLLDRRWAQEWLSDRGLGKAMQFLDLGGDEDEAGPTPIDLSGLSVAELRDLQRRLGGGSTEQAPASDPGDEPEPNG